MLDAAKSRIRARISQTRALKIVIGALLSVFGLRFCVLIPCALSSGHSESFSVQNWPKSDACVPPTSSEPRVLVTKRRWLVAGCEPYRRFAPVRLGNQETTPVQRSTWSRARSFSGRNASFKRLAPALRDRTDARGRAFGIATAGPDHEHPQRNNTPVFAVRQRARSAARYSGAKTAERERKSTVAET